MEKSRGMAIASSIFGLFFWIPLVNLISGALAMYLGVKSLIQIRRNPAKYCGKGFAITGIVLGALVYITYLTALGMCLFGFKEICKNIGMSFLAR